MNVWVSTSLQQSFSVPAVSYLSVTALTIMPCAHHVDEETASCAGV